MALGIILGNTVDSVGPALQKGQLVGVSVPIGKLFTFAHYTNGPLASPLAFIHSSQFITHPSKLWILFFTFSIIPYQQSYRHPPSLPNHQPPLSR